MADLSSTEFCRILGKVSDQLSYRPSAVASARYGLNRLAGSMKLAARNIKSDLTTPLTLTVPIDVNLYAQLNLICPGLLPPLPANAAAAVAAVSALNALLRAESPGDLLKSMLQDPLQRMQRIQDTLRDVKSQVQSLISGGGGPSIKIPGSAGELAKSVAGILEQEARSLITKKLADTLAKSGISLDAVVRCSAQVCQVRRTF